MNLFALVGEVHSWQQSLLFWLVIAYLSSSIPFGLWIGYLRGADLQKQGSGNIGATNAARVLGWKWGLLVFCLDILKAFLPVYLATSPEALGHLADHEVKLAWVGFAAVVGHVYPLYLRFHGGKGVACALGVFTALLPMAALMGFLLYVQTILLTRISALGSLTGATALGLYVWLTPTHHAYRILALVLVLLIWWTHRCNLWKKELR